MVRAANEKSPAFYVGCVVWTIFSILLTTSGFGVIAFCGTVIALIWCFGLREKFSSEETASAYSVFNTDGKAIAGTYTASHLERQMRGGFRTTTTNNGHGDDDDDDPVRGAVATADSKRNSNSNSKVNDQERLRRRRAAAAAAEKRFLQTSDATTG